MASSDSQIDKPQRGHPKRAELLDVNINTGAQRINTERASLVFMGQSIKENPPCCDVRERRFGGKVAIKLLIPLHRILTIPTKTAGVSTSSTVGS